MNRQKELQDFVRVAIECSTYVAPNMAGLTYDELFEVGQRIRYETGEIRDAINYVPRAEHAVQHGSMLQPAPDLNPLWDNFLNAEEPDFRSGGAFDFVLAQFRDVARKLGGAMRGSSAACS
jgi:hypothetical protein